MTLLELLMWVGIGLGLLLVLRPGTVLRATLPVLRERLGAARAALAKQGWAAWRLAGRLLTVTEAEPLRPTAAIGQVVGATVLTAAGVVFAVCDLALTWATLAPLFGIPYQPQGTLFASFDWLLGVSLVLLALVYGFILSDLVGWTMLTRFAVVQHGRVGAFCLAFLGFVASLGIAIALSAYRLPALLSGDGGSDALPELLAWVQTLPGPILLTLAAVLFVGAALALLSLETFCAAVVALWLTVGGGALGLGSVLLRMADLAVEMVLVAVTALATEPRPQAMAAGLQRVGQGITNRTKAFGAWLEALVRRKPPRAEPPTAGTVLTTS